MTQHDMNYAKALFDLNISAVCVQNSKDIILENRELLDVLSDPTIKKREKHAVIDSIFDKEIRNFLKALCDNESIEHISRIFDIYEEVVLDSKNIIKAYLSYVTKPDENQLEKFKKFVCNKYNKKSVLLELKEDSSLIGGFILSIGDIEYDKSIKGTLLSLHKTL